MDPVQVWRVSICGSGLDKCTHCWYSVPALSDAPFEKGATNASSTCTTDLSAMLDEP
jgi:hypothetical protein